MDQTIGAIFFGLFIGYALAAIIIMLVLLFYVCANWDK